MTAPDPLRHRTFVYAQSILAEVLCHANLLELTSERAEELRFIHQCHRPDECTVHLEAAYLLLIEAD
ncbi:hypothetical protein [Nocardia sp. alder85J]|uniref:hypothetical protein n=1 Tax=Nocardia sp. alder85J TaxID=2862949 RepID=UPI001CD7AFE2|nr:hypothetical protein [Nocardia sp. alder85J]MCX4098037.1 hypothetical protein [Nocardia sp. alder85J]